MRGTCQWSTPSPTGGQLSASGRKSSDGAGAKVSPHHVGRADGDTLKAEDAIGQNQSVGEEVQPQVGVDGVDGGVVKRGDGGGDEAAEVARASSWGD